MKIIKTLIILLLLAGIGSFAYLAFTDVPIERHEVTKTVPNERFFGDS